MMAGEFVDLAGSVWDELRADADPRFDPPHSTVQANMIEGGTAANILAREALVTWEYRCLPDRDAEAIIDTGASARRRAKSCRNISAAPPEARYRDRTACQLSRPGDGRRLARHRAGARTDRRQPGRGRCLWHRSRPFPGVGIPAVICGPGSIEQAHGRRVLRPQRTRGLRSLPAQSDREGLRLGTPYPACIRTPPSPTWDRYQVSKSGLISWVLPQNSQRARMMPSGSARPSRSSGA